MVKTLVNIIRFPAIVVAILCHGLVLCGLHGKISSEPGSDTTLLGILNLTAAGLALNISPFTKVEIVLDKIDPKDFYLEEMLKAVPPTLRSLRADAGRFAPTNNWTLNDQEAIYPLALFFTLKDPRNPYWKDKSLLNAALQGGDAICESLYEDGTSEYVRADGTTWGRSYIQKPLSAWLETFSLLKDQLDSERRVRWEKALKKVAEGICQQLRGNGNKRLYSGIVKEDEVVWGWSSNQINSLNVLDGLNLYRAGQIFDRREWEQEGREVIHIAAGSLDPLGYWPEFGGPSPSQQIEYLQAIALYKAFSGDEAVIPYLEQGIRFQIKFVYPDGSLVETVDNRERYSPEVLTSGHFALSEIPEGRRLVKFLIAKIAKRGAPLRLSSSLVYNFVYYRDGDDEKLPLEKKSFVTSIGGKALLRKKSPWFYCLSGFTAPPTRNRWGLDYQNFLSVWHEQLGLIVGGGNSKSQVEWSSFILPRGNRLLSVPTKGEVRENRLFLEYEGKVTYLEVQPESSRELRIHSGLQDSSSSATGQLVIHMSVGNSCKTGAGGIFSLSSQAVEIKAKDAGGWMECEGWRLSLPAGSRVNFPVYPFDPEDRRGKADLNQARGVLSFPLNAAFPAQVVTITVIKP